MPASTSRPSTRSPISISIRRFARFRSRAISAGASARRQPPAPRTPSTATPSRIAQLRESSQRGRGARRRSRARGNPPPSLRAVRDPRRRSRGAGGTASPPSACASVRPTRGEWLREAIGVRGRPRRAALARGDARAAWVLSAAVRGRDAWLGRLRRGSAARGAARHVATDRRRQTAFGAAGFRVLRQHSRARLAICSSRRRALAARAPADRARRRPRSSASSASTASTSSLATAFRIRSRVNPRWSASMELVERALRRCRCSPRMRQACLDGVLPDFDLRAAFRRRSPAIGKAIVFARQDRGRRRHASGS